MPDLDDFVTRFYIDYPSCKQFVTDFYSTTNLDGVNVRGEVNNCISSGWDNCESEDETECVGETSECETLVTDFSVQEDNYNGISKTEINLEENLNTLGNGDSSLLVDKNSISSDTTESFQQLQVVSTLPFSSATLITADFGNSIGYSSQDNVDRENFTYDNISNDSSVETNCHVYCLTRNVQISHANSELIIMNQSDDATEELVTQSDSYSDVVNQENMSFASPNISTILIKAANTSLNDSLVNHRSTEEDNTTQSPIDSGMGTMVSCSDTGSFSDRSPDTALASTVEEEEAPKVESKQEWHVETIPCTCTLSSQSSVSEDKLPNNQVHSRTDEIIITSVSANIPCVNEQSDCKKCMRVNHFRHNINLNENGASEVLNNLDSHPASVSGTSSSVTFSCDFDENIPHSNIHRKEKLICKCGYKSVISEKSSSPNTKVNCVQSTDQVIENGESDLREKWVGVASGNGQCSLCSSNEVRIQNQTRVLLLGSELDYSANWNYLRREHLSDCAGSSSSKTEVPSTLSDGKKSGLHWKGKNRGISPGARTSKKQVPSPLTNKSVPIQSGRYKYILIYNLIKHNVFCVIYV